MTQEEVTTKLNKFFGRGKNGIMLYIPEKEDIFMVMIGDGNNLLPEDRKEGFNAYLYIKTYQYDDPDFEEMDGGELMYVSENEKYDTDICFAVYDALEFHYTEVPDFILLQVFAH